MAVTVKDISNEQVRSDIEKFNIGDTIKVHLKIVEGEKQRVQVAEGVVISVRGERVSKTFTIRKISYGIGVERIFPINSPSIEKVTVVKRGDVRTAKLYYLKNLKGKAATKIKEAAER